MIRYVLGVLCLMLLWGCPKGEHSKSSAPDTVSNEGAAELRQRHTVLEILERPVFRDAAPVATEISFEKYTILKAEYVRKCEHYRPGGNITYYQKEGDGSRAYCLRLESFDNDSVWVAELTQFKSKAGDWLARYRLKRSPEVDREFRIPQILEERSKVVGGVKYGMSVDEVLDKKGMHYKNLNHQEAGSSELVYDDIDVSVRGWRPGSGKGRVVGVRLTSERMKEFMKKFPYEDE
jgi:hypothetical protein